MKNMTITNQATRRGSHRPAFFFGFGFAWTIGLGIVGAAEPFSARRVAERTLDG